MIASQRAHKIACILLPLCTIIAGVVHGIPVRRTVYGRFGIPMKDEQLRNSRIERYVGRPKPDSESQRAVTTAARGRLSLYEWSSNNHKRRYELKPDSNFRSPLVVGGVAAQSPTLTPRLVRTKQAAHYVGISPWLLRKLVSNKQVKPVVLSEGAPWLFDLTDLDRLIDSGKGGVQ